MPTTYTNGLKLPDLGSIDWFNAYKNNIDILDPIVGTVNGVATTYAPISHNHDASEITSGTIDIARLPPAALERLHTVADQTARYALTTSTVQEGDTVKQLDTGVMYLVVDVTKLNSADGYTEYSAGTASKAIADEDGNSIKSTYGKLAGINTWTNINTWTTAQVFLGSLRFNNASYASGTPSENIFYTALQWGGYVNNTWTAPFTINNAVRTTGYNDTSLRVYSQTSNTLTGFVHETNADASDIAFRPIANATHKLGNASYQWSAVYAQTYYYNGTAWGLNKANVWTGENKFNQSVTIAGQSGILWDRKNYTAGTLPASTMYYGFQNAYESGGSVFDRIRSYVSTTGTNLSEHVKYAWTDLTKYASVTFWVSADGSDSEYKYNTSRVIPATTNTTDLGTSAIQWKSIHGQTYYYNGTQWGLDRNNTWTGSNTFNSSITAKGDLMLLSPTFEYGTEYPTAIHRNVYFTNGSVYPQRIRFWMSGGATFTEMTVQNKFTDGVLDPNGTLKTVTLQIGLRANGDRFLYTDGTWRCSLLPYVESGSASPDSTLNLGTSSYKWKTLNGINPGALGFPDLSKAVTIDTTDWDKTGNLNSYTPLVDGWISIITDNASTANYIRCAYDNGDILAKANGNGYAQGLSIFMPVLKNTQLGIRLVCTTIGTAKLYPCLGNV